MTTTGLRTAGTTAVPYDTLKGCRACGNGELLPILDLGQQALTGVFPRDAAEPDLVSPLELIRCSPAGCGLAQLRHDVDMRLMYGERYGYRSSIRPFMVSHLASKVAAVTALAPVGPDDLVLDIGSNDGTLLGAYERPGPTLVGCDPSAAKFRDRYPAGSKLIVDFFSAERFRAEAGERRATIVTSIAMFYDLPDPVAFMRDVREVLADDGVWMLEHSYLPAMLDATCYDNICHEHLEFYAFAQIEYLVGRAGLKVLSSEVTDVYGGSLCSVLARDTSAREVDEVGLERLRAAESAAGLATMRPFEDFTARVHRHREQLREFLDRSRAAGLRTLGYGASTKGNVVLQYCEITVDDLPCVGEVNAEKDGCLTPGTRIPIVSEEAAKARRPDQLLVLPWIYREGFLERERDFLEVGGKLIFPLPELDVVGL